MEKDTETGLTDAGFTPQEVEGEPQQNGRGAGFYQEAPEWAKAFPMLHQSIAKEFQLSPLHAWHKAFKEAPEPFDDARNFGQVCHAVLLGAKGLVVVEAPDWRTSEARKKRDTALADGKLPVLQHRFDKVANIIVNAVHPALLSHELRLSDGQSEMTAIWKDDGVWCQGRLDHLILSGPRVTKKEATILDFKFVGWPATKSSCEKHFITDGYDIQHAAYVEAVETIFPPLRGRVKMYFVFIEIDAPHAVRFMPVAGSMRQSGQWRWSRAREQWKYCLRKYGTTVPWPAYSDDGEAANCPPWALSAQKEEAALEEVTE